jgi:subtilisin family serine protease
MSRMRLLGVPVLAAAMAVAGTAVPARAEGRVLGVGVPGAVPGRYIVTTPADGGARVASMTSLQARRLAADPAVIVEQDRRVHVSAYTQAGPTWNLDRIDQRGAAGSKSYTPMDDGSAVHAYVIDTGVRISHTEFAGRAAYGWDFVDRDKTATDCNGHGTHVAGTIGGARYGVAKKVRLVAVRVLDCDGDGLLSDVIDGVNWVTKYAVKPAVANLSLGGSRSSSLDAAVARSIKAGVTYAVAAGNENVNATTSSPAALAAAITVGATDSRDRRASFSNYGSVLDLFAPGVDIKSSVSSSDTAAAYYSGTSMATPQVAGAAAMVLDAAPTFTPAQVRDYLVNRATPGKVTDPKGSPNRLLFVPAPATAPAVTTTRLSATAGKTYALQLATSPGRRGTWTLAGGSLPAGLTITAAGKILGTPTGPGSALVKVRFTDYVPNTVVTTMTVAVAHTMPTFATAALPGAEVGRRYQQVIATADKRTGSWSVTAGTLPAGLQLNTVTGVVSGTPVTSGPVSFTISFTDIWGTTISREFTIEATA